MPSLYDTITHLPRLPGWAASNGEQARGGRLGDLEAFGSNPGDLRARIYVPEGLAPGSALVVVLHGCTQTADGYDVGAGWSQLADRHGFALLFPEQQRRNNPNLCFNWFSPADNRRDHGEALSIREMIAAMTDRHNVDPARVYVTGLSAGGAMTAVMLATYPEVFAGGAIIAGLPYGCAGTVPQALERMRGQALPREAELASILRRASSHSGPWPTLSVWHGSTDMTVSPANADAIVGQWRGVHGVAAAPSRTETVDGYVRRVWCAPDGREVIEAYSIAGMGHGTPLATSGDEGCGRSGAYMLEAGISSTRHISRFWGLAPDQAGASGGRNALRPVPLGGEAEGNPPRRHRRAPANAPAGVGKIIEDALRAAGLMR